MGIIQTPFVHGQHDMGVTESKSSWGYWTHFVCGFVLVLLWRFQQHQLEGHLESPKRAIEREIADDITVVESIDSDEDDEGGKQEESLISEKAKLELHGLVPSSTSAECARFVKASRTDIRRAKDKLEAYLKWHQEHALFEKSLEFNGEPRTDEDEWILASQVAIIACNEKSGVSLDRIAGIYCDNIGTPIRDFEGHRILHVMPGRVDAKIAHPNTYALALALFINKKLDRSSSEKITVVIDVRGRKGWPNIHPCRQLPFIKAITGLLLAMFPERLHRCLLLPVPASAMWIWNLCSVWIDPLTVAKINLLEGEARIFSPAPFKEMEVFMSPKIALMLECRRNEGINE